MSAERDPNSELERPASLLLEYVTTHGCRDCGRFEELLSRVRPDYPSLEIREVNGESERGFRISVGRGILRFPIIVLDDEVIGIEAIDEDDLRHALMRRLAAR